MGWYITTAVLLGFAMGYMTSRALMYDHFLNMGEHFAGRLMKQLKENEAASFHFNLSRYNIDDDDDDGSDSGVLLDDPHEEAYIPPWGRN